MLLLLLFVVVGAFAKLEVHQCHHKATWGPRNTLPINDGHKNGKLVKTSKNGKLFVVSVPQINSNASNIFHVAHVWGSAYERGFAQGELYGPALLQFLDDTWSYLESQVDQSINKWIALPKWLEDLIADFSLDTVLDLTYDVTKEYTGAYFYEELKGMCESQGHTGPSSACFKKAMRIHMLAGYTQGACSLFGSWGKASANGHTLQLRALDWDMNGPFRNFPALTVYHANDNSQNSFVTIGMVGFIGALSGMSDQQMGISEIGVSYPDATFGEMSRFGIPFIFLLRDILQFDQTIAEATSRMQTVRRTCDLILGVGDGKAKEVRGYEYSYSTLDVFDDKNMRPVNNTWHFHIPEMIYWGMDWLCPGYSEVLGTQLRKNHGSLTPEIAISDVIAVEMSGDVHIGVYDLTEQHLFVSFAAPHGTGGAPKAYARQYTKFNTTMLFSEPHP